MRCLRPPARHSPPRATREVGSVRKRACLVRDSPLGDFRTHARAEAGSPIRAAPAPPTAERPSELTGSQPFNRRRTPTPETLGARGRDGRERLRIHSGGAGRRAETLGRPGRGIRPVRYAPAPHHHPPRFVRPQFLQLCPRADEPNPTRAPRLTLPSTRSPPHLPQRRYRRHLTPREPPRRRRRGTASREPR